SHRPTPCGVTTSPPRITRSSMARPPSLHLGLRLPPDELRVDLLEELRVEDPLGGNLRGDPVERVEEVDELAHAAVDLVGHLHRIDVEGGGPSVGPGPPAEPPPGAWGSPLERSSWAALLRRVFALDVFQWPAAGG